MSDLYREEVEGIGFIDTLIEEFVLQLFQELDRFLNPFEKRVREFSQVHQKVQKQNMIEAFSGMLP